MSGGSRRIKGPGKDAPIHQQIWGEWEEGLQRAGRDRIFDSGWGLSPVCAVCFGVGGAHVAQSGCCSLLCLYVEGATGLAERCSPAYVFRTLLNEM